MVICTAVQPGSAVHSPSLVKGIIKEKRVDLAEIGIEDTSRIHWACRRGMLELDIAVRPFFEHEYHTLTDAQKRTFIVLLKADDPDLFNWLMGHGQPASDELKGMVELIRTRNSARGPVAN